MWRVGILGGGNISETHLQACLQLERVQVVAVCGTNERKVRALSNSAGAEAYLHLERFLNHHPMEIVLIGSPSGLHAEQGMAAARQGKHLLIEKPLDIKTQRIDELMETVARTGVRLGVFLQERAAADLQRVKRMLDDGKLGKGLVAAAELLWSRNSEYYADSRWRGTWELDGGGALMNQGIHTVDLLLWFFGPISQVSAFCRTQMHAIETEDTVAAILEFEAGPVAALSVTTTAFPGLPRRIVIVGDQGTIQIEGSFLKSFEAKGQTPEIGGKQMGSERRDSPRISDSAGHRIVLEDFLEALEQDRAPLCDGAAARKSVEIVEAIYEASRTGSVVKLRS